MQTLEGLKKKIKTTNNLKGIVSSMKTLSAVSVGQYDKATKALIEYNNNIEMGLQAVLKNKILPKKLESKEYKKATVVMFGSDQGLVGKFNKAVIEYALEQLEKEGFKQKDITFVAAGRSMVTKLVGKGINVDTLFTMPNSVKAITSVVKSIVLRLNEIRIEHSGGDKEFQFSNSGEKVYIFYNRKTAKSFAEPKIVRLLPIDKTFLKEIKDRDWPNKSLPMHFSKRRTLFTSFIRQLLFVKVYRALAESLASEHMTRMISMQNAEKNIDEHLDSMNMEYQQRRQAEITSELLDVVSGAEVLNKKKKTA